MLVLDRPARTVVHALVDARSAAWARVALPGRAQATTRLVGVCLMVVLVSSMVAAASADANGVCAGQRRERRAR